MQDLSMERYHAAYSILVHAANAPESMREEFVQYFTAEENRWGTREWRFGGKLGFGGKFWRRTHTDPPIHDVTCYSENETPELRDLIQVINKALEIIFYK